MSAANAFLEQPCVNDLRALDRRSSLTEDLLDYWIRYPEAQGTVEAIVEWWLLEQRIQQATADVRFVLTELVAKAFVVERQQADGRICYRLNRQREAEIRAWLESGNKKKK